MCLSHSILYVSLHPTLVSHVSCVMSLESCLLLVSCLLCLNILDDGMVLKTWISIKSSGSLSIWSRRFVIASGHYLQVFALDAEDLAPLLVLDLSKLTIDSGSGTEDEFRLTSTGVAFSFKASSAESQKSTISFLERLQKEARLMSASGAPSPVPHNATHNVNNHNARMAAKADLLAIEESAKRRAMATLCNRFQVIYLLENKKMAGSMREQA